MVVRTVSAQSATRRGKAVEALESQENVPAESLGVTREAVAQQGIGHDAGSSLDPRGPMARRSEMKARSPGFTHWLSHQPIGMGGFAPTLVGISRQSGEMPGVASNIAIIRAGARFAMRQNSARCWYSARSCRSSGLR